MRKFSLYLALLSLLFLTSCSEKLEINVVFPPENYRVTDPYSESQPYPVPVIVKYNGTDKEEIAIISLAGKSYGCTLISGQEVNCGSFPITTMGGQLLQVQAYKDNGERVLEQVNFRWEPYQGMEAVAYNFSGLVGPKSVPLGYFYLFVILLLLAGVVVVLNIFNKGYIHRGSDSVDITLQNRFGDKIKYLEKRGGYTGPANSDQPRPRLEPQAFRQHIKFLTDDPEEAAKILLSQGDFVDAQVSEIE